MATNGTRKYIAKASSPWVTLAGQVVEAITPLLKSQQHGYRLVSARVRRLEGRVALLESKLQSIELPPAPPPTNDGTVLSE